MNPISDKSEPTINEDESSAKAKTRHDSRRDSKPKEVTVVEVRNPVTHQTKFASFTDFEICIKTTSKAFTLAQSHVRRRYSDFVWLRNWLERHTSIGSTPRLPPKKIIGRFDDEFLEIRMKGLQKFLKKVLRHNVFLSDKALHLFLQSSLSISQIEDYMNGKPIHHTQRSPSLNSCDTNSPSNRIRGPRHSRSAINPVIQEEQPSSCSESGSVCSSLSSFTFLESSHENLADSGNCNSDSNLSDILDSDSDSNTQNEGDMESSHK